MAEHRYRCTHVVSYDYGDGAGVSPPYSIAHMAIIPDGSHWMDRPATFTTRVPYGERPGSIWRVSIEREEPNP